MPPLKNNALSNYLRRKFAEKDLLNIEQVNYLELLLFWQQEHFNTASGLIRGASKGVRTIS